MALTREQVQQNIVAMEQQGAKPQDIQSYLDSLKGQTQAKPSLGQQLKQGVKVAARDAITGGPIRDVKAGFKASAAETAGGIGSLIEKGARKLTGNQTTEPTVGQQVQERARESIAQNPRAQAAKTVGDIAQFVGPSSAVVGASRAATGAVKGSKAFAAAPKFVQKTIPTAVKAATEGTAFAAFGTAKRGSTEGVGTDFALGAAFPVAGAVVKPIARQAIRIARGGTKFGTSQLTGIKPSAIDEILKNPQKFTPEAMQQVSRDSITNRIGEAATKRLAQLSGTGKEYQKIRASKNVVKVPENLVDKVIGKFGIKVVNGRVTTSVESVPMQPGDINALQLFYDQYGRHSRLSANAFLNARKALSNLSAFDSTKTNVSKAIARNLRGAFDKLGKKQIPGLRKLDKKFAPEISFMNKIKKDLFNADGTIKDNASSKIANITNKGKEQQLRRLKKIIPDIDDEVNILKAVEDIQYAGQNKIGTYGRALASLGAGAATGNPVLLVGGLLASSPTTTVPIIRSFAKLRGIPKGTINKTINKMRTGKPLSTKEKGMVGDAIRQRFFGAADTAKATTRNAASNIFDRARVTPKPTAQDVQQFFPINL